MTRRDWRGPPSGCPPSWDWPGPSPCGSSAGRSLPPRRRATGPALEAAVLYSDVLFLGAVPFWLFNAAASVLRGGGNAAYPAAAGAVGGLVTLAVSPLVIFG